MTTISNIGLSQPIFIFRSGTTHPDKQKSSQADTERQFRKAIKGIISRTSNAHTPPSGKADILLEKVGYDFSGNLGLVVRQRDVDVSTGKNLTKRYQISLRVMG